MSETKRIRIDDDGEPFVLGLRQRRGRIGGIVGLTTAKGHEERLMRHLGDRQIV